MMTQLFRGTLICAICAGIVGCESKAGTGALVGTAGGAGVGAIIGNQSRGRGTEGALIGAAVGAIGGALVGHGMDKADEKKERQNDRSAAQEYDRRNTSVASSTISKTDVVSWTQRGTSDDVIVDRIERGNTVFRLTAADENDLRDRGVSPTVIRAMRDTTRR